MEYTLDDRSRVDCLTANYAVEVEFAHKFKEAVGQALHYARKTGRKPAIVLIIENDKDWPYFGNLKAITRKKNIKLWYITPEEL